MHAHKGKANGFVLTHTTVFSPEAQYYTQKRKVKQLKGTEEEYEQQKAQTADFYREADNVNYVNAPKLPRENVDRMVDDLKLSYVYTAPHRTAPHRTAPHRTAPHRTAPTSVCDCVSLLFVFLSLSIICHHASLLHRALHAPTLPVDFGWSTAADFAIVRVRVQKIFA